MVCDTLQFPCLLFPHGWGKGNGNNTSEWITGKLRKKNTHTHTPPRNFFPLDFYFVEENPMITYACSIRSSALTRASVLVSEVGLLLMGATKVCEQTVIAQQNLHVV